MFNKQPRTQCVIKNSTNLFAITVSGNGWLQATFLDKLFVHSWAFKMHSALFDIIFIFKPFIKIIIEL